MEVRLFDSERKVMELLWSSGEMTARELADRLKEQVGWSKTTTYTVVKKCVDKGVVERVDPGFLCRPLVTREAVCLKETEDLLDRNFGGSADLMVAQLLGRHRLSGEEIARLKKRIEELE